MFFPKKNPPVTPYDPSKEIPELHSNTCNRDKVAGFRNTENGRFTEKMTIQSEADLKEFCRQYAVDERKIRKVW